MKKVVDEGSNVGEGRSGGDGGGGDAVTTLRKGRNDGEVGGSDESGVVAELGEFPGANQNGSEFENCETLAGSGRNTGFNVEENNLRAIFY